MRAFQLEKIGAAPGIRQIDIPTPKDGEVRLAVEACGLNFADLLIIEGRYQERPDLPLTLGMEMAGTIDALGKDVTGFQPGVRVAAFAGHGGLADYACVPASRCVKLPDAMPATDAAAFLVAYGTSHLALGHRANLQPGETLLVLGAAGGVGLTAVEIGKQMGARVIACARGGAKLAIAKAAGADHLIDSETDDIRDAVKALGGADVVYDPVGGSQFSAALRACNPGARVLVIGFASGEVPPVPANILLVKNITVIGHYWGGYLKFAPAVLTESLTTLLGWYEAGKIRPHISHVLPLEQSGEALDLLRTRKSTGKVVIRPS